MAIDAPLLSSRSTDPPLWAVRITLNTPEPPPGLRTNLLPRRITVSRVLNEASVGAAYDAVAELYTSLYTGQISADAGERWVIDRFAELCRDAGNEAIADLGCGPGRLAEHLATSGNRVTGVDVSSEMIRIARDRSPGLDFEVGSMSAFLRARPDAIGNALFWYSLIHTAPPHLSELLAEAFAAVRAGGYVLVGFQSMADPAAASQSYDHRVAPAYLYSLAEIRRRLVDAGFSVLHLGLRAPGPGERVPAGYALAQKLPHD